jgi:hypothetical protein
MSDAADKSWLFDYVVTFLRSPPWTVPLNEFIDEHCIVFDGDDDNKLEYSTIHDKFCELIDSLLGSNLQAIGVTEEQFVDACQQGANQEVNKLVFGQILAVDDFLTFKKMMVKRNVELNIEAMEMLASPTFSQDNELERAAGPVGLKKNRPTTKEEEKLQLEIALKLSQNLGSDAAQSSGGAIKGGVSDDEMLAALKASVVEAGKQHATYDREQAELEHAIAMSLALESDRLKNLNIAADAADAAESGASAPTEEASAPPDYESPRAEAAATSAPDYAGKDQVSLTSLPALKLPTVKAVPRADIERQERELEVRVEDAAANSEANKQAAKMRKANEEDALRKRGGVSKSELEMRQAFLRAQRELILKKKKAERQLELDRFEREKESAAGDSAAQARANAQAAAAARAGNTPAPSGPAGKGQRSKQGKKASAFVTFICDVLCPHKSYFHCNFSPFYRSTFSLVAFHLFTL